MGTEFSRLKKENQRSIKCYLAVNRHLQQALLDVVHDPQYDGIPVDPVELYKFFNQPNNIKIINNLRKNKVLKQDQISLLLPQNQRTFSNKWDVTLICVVVINFTKLKPPTNGWKKTRDPNDTSTAAHLVMGRDLRNRSNHATLQTFCDEVDFKTFFTETRVVIVGLQYKHINEFDNLNNDDVDPTTIKKDDIDLFMNNIKSIKGKENFLEEIRDWLKDNEKGNFNDVYYFNSYNLNIQN